MSKALKINTNRSNLLVDQIEKLIEQGMSLHQKGSLNEARDCYLKILEKKPSHFDALHLLGLIEYQSNNLEKAYESINKAISINSKNAFAYSNLGVVLMGLKRPSEAIKNYDKAITLKQDYAEAYNNKGAAFAALAKFNQALESYDLAIKYKPNYDEAHNNRGNLLQELNDFEGALKCYEKAIEINQQYSVAYTNRGNALFKLQRYDESIKSYNKAIELNPRCINSYSNRGNSLLKLKRYEEALQSYDTAIQLNPKHAETFSNRGVALKDLGKHENALENYERAISLNPKYPDPYINKGNILADLGKWELAFENYLNLLEFDQSYKAKMGFINCIKNLTSLKVTSKLEALIEQAISEAWARPSDLIPIARSLLLNKLELNSPEELPKVEKRKSLSNQKYHIRPDVNKLLNNSLFQCILKNDSIGNDKFELLLTDVRKGLIYDLVENNKYSHCQSVVVERQGDCNRLINFLCALATQCFINEYAYANTKEELSQVRVLSNRIANKKLENLSIPPCWLAIIACYLPLNDLQIDDELLNQSWPECLKQLIRMQISEPKIEKGYRDDIPSLVRIEDSVSRLVREQYEANPYPRWIKTIGFVEGISLDEMLIKAFPKASFRKLGKESNIDVLIAGCGTGQHPIETAQMYKNSSVMAIDLSISSLCYAKRKAVEMGVGNINFAQADILGLGSLDKKFDLIESVGVLHHLAKPLVGWRILLRLLQPNGFMKIGLYSELARSSVVAAREYIVKRKFSTSPEDIRRCRQEILNLNEKNPISKIVNFTDFYSLSECRDLIFHVQEHRYTLLQLKEILRDLNLNFIGFTLRPSVIKQYTERFPDDISRTNLENWHLFEIEFPDTFRSMYQFFVQKNSN